MEHRLQNSPKSQSPGYSPRLSQDGHKTTLGQFLKAPRFLYSLKIFLLSPELQLGLRLKVCKNRSPFFPDKQLHMKSHFSGQTLSQTLAHAGHIFTLKRSQLSQLYFQRK